MGVEELIPFINLGIGGLGLIGFMVGKIFSARAVEIITQSFEARLSYIVEENRELKAGLKAANERGDVLARHVAELTELGRTSNAILASLPNSVKAIGGN